MATSNGRGLEESGVRDGRGLEERIEDDTAPENENPKDPGPFALKVDPLQDYKATEIKICSFTRPHMRAFHYAWWAGFNAESVWFALGPFLPEVQRSLGLTDQQIWLSNIIAVSGDIVVRFFSGGLVDKWGARILIAAVLLSTSIPAFCNAFVKSFVGLCVLRLFVSYSGSVNGMGQAWTAKMFANEIIGYANGITGGWGKAGDGLQNIILGAALFPLFRDVVYKDDPDCGINAGKFCTCFDFLQMKSRKT